MKITVDLSTPEQHPVSAIPKAIRQLWYGESTLLELLSPTGSPNHGGQHIFRFTSSPEEVFTKLDLFVESYPNTHPEIYLLKKQISLGIDKGDDFCIKLKDITRQVCHNDEIITRRWFWIPEWEETNV